MYACYFLLAQDWIRTETISMHDWALWLLICMHQLFKIKIYQIDSLYQSCFQFCHFDLSLCTYMACTSSIFYVTLPCLRDLGIPFTLNHGSHLFIFICVSYLLIPYIIKSHTSLSLPMLNNSFHYLPQLSIYAL